MRRRETRLALPPLSRRSLYDEPIAPPWRVYWRRVVAFTWGLVIGFVLGMVPFILFVVVGVGR